MTSVAAEQVIEKDQLEDINHGDENAYKTVMPQANKPKRGSLFSECHRITI